MRIVAVTLLVALTAAEAVAQQAAEEDPAYLDAAERIVRQQEIQLQALQHSYVQPYRRVYGPPYSVLYPRPYGPSPFAMPYYATAPDPIAAPLPPASGQPIATDGTRRLQDLLSEVDGAASPPADEGETADPGDAAAQQLTPRQQAILDRATDNLRRSQAFRDYLYGRVQTEQLERQADLNALYRATLFPSYGYGYGYAPPPVYGYGPPVYPGYPLGYYGW